MSIFGEFLKANVVKNMRESSGMSPKKSENPYMSSFGNLGNCLGDILLGNEKTDLERKWDDKYSNSGLQNPIRQGKREQKIIDIIDENLDE